MSPSRNLYSSKDEDYVTDNLHAQIVEVKTSMTLHFFRKFLLKQSFYSENHALFFFFLKSIIKSVGHIFSKFPSDAWTLHFLVPNTQVWLVVPKHV